MEAVEAANGGHRGMPWGWADVAGVLGGGHLKHNPADPLWPDRDRFVLSNGHGSMLLYALLHLTGYALPLEELKRFRQLHSKTPGHPEVGVTPGVETTTGPLGQGLANAVDRKSTRLNSSHGYISYAVFCLKTNFLAPLLDQGLLALPALFFQRVHGKAYADPHAGLLVPSGTCGFRAFHACGQQNPGTQA